jgi:hypothetical protein
MARPSPSAAEALCSHLKRQVPEPRQQQRTGNSVAAAMWPSLVPKPPKPANPMRDAILPKFTGDQRAQTELRSCQFTAGANPMEG